MDQTRIYVIVFLVILGCGFNSMYLYGQSTRLTQESIHIKKVYPSLSIDKAEIDDIQTITDLNKHYNPAWVASFTSVELMGTVEGSKFIELAKNDTLTQGQKELMQKADVDSQMSFKILYTPNNDLKINEQKEINFSFSFNPEQDAQIPSGFSMRTKSLLNFLKSNDVNVQFNQHELAVATFSIGENGIPENVEMLASTKHEKTDSLIVEFICNMTAWKPASYANGTKTSQQFALLIGDDESCTINLVNVKQDENFGIIYKN